MFVILGLVNHPGNNFVPTSPILPGQPNTNLQSQAGNYRYTLFTFMSVKTHHF